MDGSNDSALTRILREDAKKACSCGHIDQLLLDEEPRQNSGKYRGTKKSSVRVASRVLAAGVLLVLLTSPAIMLSGTMEQPAHAAVIEDQPVPTVKEPNAFASPPSRIVVAGCVLVCGLGCCVVVYVRRRRLQRRVVRKLIALSKSRGSPEASIWADSQKTLDFLPPEKVWEGGNG